MSRDRLMVIATWAFLVGICLFIIGVIWFVAESMAHTDMAKQFFLPKNYDQQSSLVICLFGVGFMLAGFGSMWLLKTFALTKK